MAIDFSIWFEHDILKQILAVWRKAEQEAYLVGGAVRDGLLGKLEPDADLDLLVPRDALAVSRRLANALNAAFYPLDAKRGVGRVVFSDHRYLDIADFRAPTLEGDLRDRDFTINAIALKLNETSPELIDPTAGQDDLRRKIVRTTTDASIETDPLRAVRGVRMAQSLGFEIEPATVVKISAAASGLKQISGERLRDELQKLFAASSPAGALEQLQSLGLLPEILPEVLPMVGVAQSPPHHLPVWEHSLRVMDTCRALPISMLAEYESQLSDYFQTELPGMLTRADLMPWAGLLHDVGKPDTTSVDNDGRIRFFGHERVSQTTAKVILRRLKFSERAVKFVSMVVRHHMRPLLLANEPAVSARAVHRFLVATGDCAPAVVVFSLCDHFATYPSGQGKEELARLVQVLRRVLAAYFSPKPKRLLSGAEVMAALGISGGPDVGRCLRRLDEAQAVGEISTKAEALAFLKR